MSQRTSIEWTDVTWNPVHGCSVVSPGCAHCYAATLSLRYGHTEKPWTPANAAENVILKPHKLREPLSWREPRMVFVNSMSDLFHELVPDRYIEQVFAVMALSARHTFQVLTKRPERMLALLRNPGVHINILRARWDVAGVEDDPGIRAEFITRRPEHPLSRTCPWPLPNVWLGTSIENRRFVHRADLLRETPATVRFISAEPLLGPLVPHGRSFDDAKWGWYTARHFGSEWNDDPGLDLTGIDWLIVGGESGPDHRPMRLEWACDLVEACRVAGVAPFVKQLGGARPGTKLEDLPEDLRIREFPRAVAAMEATA